MLLVFAIALKKGYITEEEIIKIESEEYLANVKKEMEKLDF